MKTMKGKKKFVMAFVALLIVGITLTITLFHDSHDVEATSATFDGITAKYTNSKKQVNILEIVPKSVKHTATVSELDSKTFTIDEGSELGYFMTSEIDGKHMGDSHAINNEDPVAVTRGGVHGVPLKSSSYATNSGVDKTSDEYKATLTRMYEYGIIKPSGVDGGYYTKIGEYPIYAATAVFSKFNNGIFLTPLGQRLVNGYYVENTTKSGKYNIDRELYGINTSDRNAIYSVSSVSKNDVGEIVSVSFNDIVDVDSSALSLPKTSDGTPIITVSEGKNGNLDFVDVEGVAVPYQLYKGFSVVKDSEGNEVFGDVYYSTSNQTKFASSDWWNEYVLGSLSTYEDANLKTPYTIKTADTVSVEDISNADFIYISGTYEVYKNNGVDLKPEVMAEIYNQEINYKHKAVMMDYALYSDNADTNISRLALLLWQKSQMATYKETSTDHPGWFTKTVINDDGKDYDYYSLNNDAWNDTAFLDYLKENRVPAGTGNGNFVTGNTYVYNHHMSDFKSPKSMVDALDNFANGDFNTPYTESIVTSGLGAVKNYIEKTNANASTKLMSNSISPAVCIQYILVSTGADLEAMKLTLSVLEIQPVPAYLFNTERGSREYAELDSNNADDNRILQNRMDFVKDYLSAFYSDRIQFINFTSMTVYEFNARNEDLVESYDIIYIGDETIRNGKNLYYENTNLERNTLAWTGEKYELTKTKMLSNFRDDNMIGNIYYNVGDKVEVFGKFQNGNNDGLSGWLDTDTYKTENTVTTRYSPRDITKNKLAKLEEFVKSNALVLVAEDLMGTPYPEAKEDATNPASATIKVKNTQINPTRVDGPIESNDKYGRIDNSSNLYEFLSFALGKEYTVSANNVSGNGIGAYVNAEGSSPYPNVVAVSDIKQDLVDKESLAEFVSSEKLELYMIDQPTAYSYTATDKGVITSTTSLSTVDADGTRYLEYKFMILCNNQETNEAGYSVDLYVDINKDGKFSKTRESVQDIFVKCDSGNAEANKNEANEYVLAANTEYILRRDITDDYTGLLNWKLDVKSNLKAQLHDSTTGYTLVKDPNEQKKKIKILQITNSKSTLDMEARLYDARKNGNDTNSWSLLMDNVPDYELYVRTMTVSQFEKALKDKYGVYKKQVEDANNKIKDTNGNILPGKTPIPLLSEYEYANNATEYFFKNFVIQNVDIDDTKAPETKKTHETPGIDGNNKATIVASSLGKDYINEVGVDMIVCGFGDDYDAFKQSNSLVALQDFIKNGKPVLTSHDFVHFRIGTSQNRVLRNSFGADLYGVSQDLDVTAGRVSMLNAWNAVTLDKNATSEQFFAQQTKGGLDYLHSGVSYTRSSQGNIISILEKTGKEVSYVPNSNRNTIAPQTQGISTTSIEWNRYKTTSAYTWINSDKASAGKTQWNSGGQNDLGDNKLYMVEQINEGQITNYPYRLKKNFRTTATHSQYYTLDLTSDLDNDGESDVVVWYALGDSSIKEDSTDNGSNPYNEKFGGCIDPANGYYIYSDGNVMYTGAGHKDLTDAGLDEVELFINTLIAAYENAIAKPSVGFFNTPDIDDKPITSIVVPYDGNVTNPKNGASNKYDSSVIKSNGSTEYMYKFVDPNTESAKGVKPEDGTMVFFRVSDRNFVRGTKNIVVRYFLEVPNVATDEEDGKIYYDMPDGSRLEVVSINVNGIKIKAVDISKRIITYPTTERTVLFNEPLKRNEEDGSLENVGSGRAYGFYLPMNLLNDNAGFTIYLEAKTVITSISTSGDSKRTITPEIYQPLPVVKADLLDLD